MTNETEGKHTPTLALPLRASTTHSCEVHIFDRNDEMVASIVSYTGDLTTAQLDHADFIVLAVNSHAALTARCEKLEAALRQCRAELRRNLQRERDDIQRAWLQTAHDAASDALLSDEAAK